MSNIERAAEMLQGIVSTRGVVQEAAASSNSNLPLRAKAILITIQLEVIVVYLHLLRSLPVNPVTSKSILLRSIIEFQANSLYIGTDIKKAKKYLSSSEAMHQNMTENYKALQVLGYEKGNVRPWTKRNIDERCALIAKEIPPLYDRLSDFVHGNNVADFYNKPKMLSAFEEAIDDAYILLLMGVAIDIGKNFASQLSEGQNELLIELIDKQDSYDVSETIKSNKPVSR